MMRTIIVAIIVLALVAIAPGCTAAPAMDDDPLAGVPEDFSLELTILKGRTVDPPHRLDPRPGRFIVFADGSLHHDDEVDDRRVRRAGLVRRLDRVQQADLWLLLRQINVSDAERAEPSINLDLIEPQPGEIMHQLAIIGESRRWVFIHRSPAGKEVEPALRELVTHLAELCWLPEEPVAERIVLPRRYYFGPDPYERYRR